MKYDSYGDWFDVFSFQCHLSGDLHHIGLLPWSQVGF